MKSLILFLVAFCTFSASAGEMEERKKALNYYIVKSVKDKKTPAGQSKVIFQCWAGSSNTLGSQSLQYSVDGENATVTTDKSGYFVVMTQPGTHSFQFYMDNDGFYEIYANGIDCKDGYKTVINLYFRNTSPGDYPVAEKPVIYLYPDEECEVSVQLEPKGNFTFTYPAYASGWKGTAHPDGNMTIAGKSYPYLFWEARMDNQAVDVNSGWILEQDNVVAFLEEKLTAMGLSDREQADLITYWGPRLAGSPQVFLQFAWGTDAGDRFGALNVSPQPDHVNRIYVLWTPLEESDRLTEPTPQQLPVFDRSGFDVLEWGGMEFTQDQFVAR